MKRGLLFVLPVLAAAFAACTTDVKEERQFVNLSQVVCSFHGAGNEPLAIEVKTSPTEWTVESEASWVTAERTDGRTLTITVADNDASAERSTTVTVEAGQAVQHIKVVQLAPDSEIATYRRLDALANGGVMSPGGKYVAGYTAFIDESDAAGFRYTVSFIDLDTGEVTEVGPFFKSQYDFFSTQAVTDQGVLFINLGMTGECLMIDLDGNASFVERIDGCESWPHVSRTSEDGRYWVGYVTERKGFYRPVLWTDGVPELLPMPEKNYRDEDFTTGILGRGISNDGSVIYGSTWENSDFGMVYWKRVNGEWQVAYAGKDVRKVTPVKMIDKEGNEYDLNMVNGLTCTAEHTKVSPNGKWLASMYRTETPTENRTDWILEKRAAFYNTETEQTVIIDDLGECVGVAVTDDGIAFISEGYAFFTGGHVYDLNAGTYLGTLPEWVYQHYGIHVPDSSWVRYMAPNGRLHGYYTVEMAGIGLQHLGWYVTPVGE